MGNSDLNNRVGFNLRILEILKLLEVFYIEQRYSWWNLRNNLRCSLLQRNMLKHMISIKCKVRVWNHTFPFLFFSSPFMESFHQIANWNQVIMFVSELSEEAIFMCDEVKC